MLQLHQSASWTILNGGHLLDLKTAVKDGILDSAAALPGGATGGSISGVTDEAFDMKKTIDSFEPADDAPPSVFICPISLLPMLDPVTLCTGQTYERSNIQKWLSMGHRTCPTTMQDLWDDALTPNHTLRHLIHSWFSQRHLRTKKRSEDVGEQITDILHSLRRLKGGNRVHALKELAKLVSFHTSAAITGGIPLLSSLLGPFTSHAVGAEVVAILVNLHLDSNAMENLMQPAKISLFVDMLNEGGADTKFKCAKLIEIFIKDENFRPEMLSSPSLLVGLLKLVKDKRHQNGVSIGIRLLKTICNQKQQIRGHMVRIGAAAQLMKVLPHLVSSDCLESALQILDGISSISEGRVALKDCSHTIPNLVNILMRVSEVCTKYSLSILWAVCKLSPEECFPAAVEAGLAAKLLLVIQSECSPALKQRSAELLKLCSLNYSATLFMSKCKLRRTIQ